jgi:hypothetical protein
MLLYITAQNRHAGPDLLSAPSVAEMRLPIAQALASEFCTKVTSTASEQPTGDMCAPPSTNGGTVEGTT